MSEREKEVAPPTALPPIRQVVRTEVEPMPEWDDSAAEFYFVGSIHSRYAAVISAFLGIIVVVGVFTAAIIEFDWWNYETYVDLIVLSELLLSS